MYELSQIADTLIETPIIVSKDTAPYRHGMYRLETGELFITTKWLQPENMRFSKFQTCESAVMSPNDSEIATAYLMRKIQEDIHAVGTLLADSTMGGAPASVPIEQFVGWE